MIRPARFLIVAMAFAALVVVVGCGGTGNPDASPVATSTVSMKDSEFRPSHISVAAGTTVTWTNDDDYPHDVTFGGEKSPNMDKGATYDKTFDEAGVFDYDCTIHPGMKARVTVTGS